METPDKKADTNLPEEHHHSYIEVISSVSFVILAVVGMYFLSGYLNH